ncbi:MAG: zinc transporter ZupT [Candidatus Bathyarchaeota archaeon BA1]|nr:MAG: zinc transporter ZupT [Candidatus Bathyarchaeota archaeon BA1]
MPLCQLKKKFLNYLSSSEPRTLTLNLCIRVTDLDSIIYACFLSLLAGLGTSLGGIIIIITGKMREKFLDFSMGLASGVMLTVAFLNLIGKALDMNVGYYIVALGFVIGAASIMILDAKIPHIFSFEEYGAEKELLVKTGLLVAIGITLHNVPEGLAVVAGYAYLPNLGYLIALAIALHNIPEGIATATPLYAAGMRSGKVFIITFLSGLAEPLGALIGSFMLTSPSQFVLALMLACAGGVMTYVTADELIPTAHTHGHKHDVAIGLIVGFTLILILTSAFGL